jgi:hypothetical protein
MGIVSQPEKSWMQCCEGENRRAIRRARRLVVLGLLLLLALAALAGRASASENDSCRKDGSFGQPA